MVITQPILPIPPNMANPPPPPPPHPNPRITYVIHIAYFLRWPRADPDIHVAKLEVTCATNDIPTTKFQEVFVVFSQVDAFA